ncbi:hypothetical protein PILCRDRAFT_98744 [Piloderma croceum F 1598]|uniref:GATA-type domain-containing protein n=1 Tax=Piloderma croceum (strain F 1598) TaxID=765440 RepID=A0A0C3EV24_PILCF|nr:hypothetical protein PILCRDRAFT_98744 [Piloderma croceum F 1598]
MDSLHFDAYTSYSDSSTPGTPSPRTSVSSDEMQSYTHSPANFKQPLDIDAVQSIFADYAGDESVVPETHSIESTPFWASVHSSPSAHNFSSRGSLLQELYEHDISHDQHNPHDMYMDQHSAERPSSGHSDWSQMSHEQHIHMQAQQQHQQQQVHVHRRNTFPIVRHDRENAPGSQQFYNHHFSGGDHGPVGSFSARPDIYGEPIPLSTEPSALHGNRLDEPFLQSMSSSPRGSYRDFEHLEDGVKLEDAPQVIVPSQTAFYRPPSGGAMHPMSMSYLSPHTGLPVQHTDDAASKETQYLRRRCFNCHTTEPPSWRRSTLNPGKIVCNKCGLYERTHLRPRPLRFDELRAGNKARKQSKGIAGSPSPKQKLGGLVKKEPRDFGIARRSSVSSTSSSVHSSNGATSDWDDNVSLYSNGSGPPSSYNSPSVSTFPIPRDPNSQSPPSGGIRLPNNPLTDIASLQPQTPPSSGIPTPQVARQTTVAT